MGLSLPFSKKLYGVRCRTTTITATTAITATTIISHHITILLREESSQIQFKRHSS